MQVGYLKTLHVTTNNQLANIFTKALHPTKFHTLLSKMGVHNLYRRGVLQIYLVVIF